MQRSSLPRPLRSSLWRLVPGCALAVTALTALPAETVTVLDVPLATKIVVQLRGLPVCFALAHVDAAPDDAACRAKLASLAKGKSAELTWLTAFGTEPDGTAKVQLSIGTTAVNAALVEAGLARYAPGKDPTSADEKLMAMAEGKAKSAKRGVWAAGSAPTLATTSSGTGSSAADPVPVAARSAPGAFAAELSGKYYYPVGHRALTGINPQRLISYADEAAARKAGKQPPPPDVAVSAPRDVAGADALYEEGRSLVAKAIDQGNTPQRDALYGQAIPKLTAAMQAYSALIDAGAKDKELPDKLSACMQTRYLAMKNRRL